MNKKDFVFDWINKPIKCCTQGVGIQSQQVVI